MRQCHTVCKFGASLLLLLLSSKCFVLGTYMSIESGRDFWLAFPIATSTRYTTSPSDFIFTVYLTNTGPSPVQVCIETYGIANSGNETRTIEAGGTVTLQPHPSVMLEAANRYWKGVHVTVTSDSGGIQVQEVLDFYFPALGIRSSGGSAVLPTHALSGTYIVVTCAYTNPDAASFFSVMATVDGSEVKVTLKVSANGMAEYKGQQYGDGAVIVEHGLKAGESIQILCLLCNTTGTLIQSNGTVAVISGGLLTKLSWRTKLDTVMEQMLPVEQLGTRYVLGSNLVDVYAGTHVLVLVMVVVPRADQNFTYNGQQWTASSDRQLFNFVRNCSRIATIVSDRPLLVAELMSSGDSSLAPDSVLTLAVPEELWASCYTLDVHAGYSLSFLLPRGGQFTVDAQQVNLTQIRPAASATGDYELVTVVVVSGEGLVTVSSNVTLWGFALYDYGLSGQAVAFTLWGRVFGTTVIDTATAPDSTPTNQPTSHLTSEVPVVTASQEMSSANDVTTTQQSSVVTSAVQSTQGTTVTTPHDVTSATTAGSDLTETSVPMTTAITATTSATTNTGATTTAGMSTATSTTTGVSTATSTPPATTTTTTGTLHSTTTTPSTTTPSTTTVPALSTRQSSSNCVCRCVHSAPSNWTVSEEEKQKTLDGAKAAIQRELSEDKTGLSSYIRKKTSSPDYRKSSVAIGLLWSAVLFIVFFGGIVLHDLVTAVSYVTGALRQTDRRKAGEEGSQAALTAVSVKPQKQQKPQ